MSGFLKSLPFMSFWPDNAIMSIMSHSEEIEFSANDVLSCNDEPFLYVVKSGFFVRLDNIDKKQGDYYLSGSFFGSLPFVESRNRIKMLSMEKSTVCRIDTAQFLRVFAEDVRLYAAYMSFLGRKNFDIKNSIQPTSGSLNTMISVSSSVKGRGKSLFCHILAKKISMTMKTLIIDLSYSGVSVFEYFGKTITQPLAEKEDSQEKVDLVDRIVPVNDSLSLLNMTNTSKVGLNLDVLSYVLFRLLGKFDCIILDVDSEEKLLQERALSYSDSVILLGGRKNDDISYISDRFCNRGQNVYLINNMYFASGNEFEAEYDFETIDINHGNFSGISEEYTNMESIAHLADEIFRPRKLLFLKTSDISAVHYAGLFRNLYEGSESFDYIAADFLGAVNALFFINSHDYTHYIKYLRDFFRIEKLKVLAEVCFPDKHVFAIDKFEKYFSGIFSLKRTEQCRTRLISCLNMENFGTVLKTSGRLSKTAAAEISVHPFFEKVDFSGALVSNQRNCISIDRWLDYIRVDSVCSVEIKTGDIPSGTGLLDDIFMSQRLISGTCCETGSMTLTVEDGLDRVHDKIAFSETGWKTLWDREFSNK